MDKVSTSKQEKLLLLFKEAIEAERTAQNKYTQMMQNCEDPELAQILESFRESEENHEQQLMRMYAALKSAGKYAD